MNWVTHKDIRTHRVAKIKKTIYTDIIDLEKDDECAPA